MHTTAFAVKKESAEKDIWGRIKRQLDEENRGHVQDRPFVIRHIFADE
jgi:hypothetical protein